MPPCRNVVKPELRSAQMNTGMENDVNHVNDVFSTSPSVADKDIYLRGEPSLYCIAEDKTL